jgi:hypothetical protein
VWSAAVPLALVATGCDRGSGSASTDRPTIAIAPPRERRTIPLHARPELRENSAAVMSEAQPGVFFTINDSGNEPVLFALDTTGADRGAWRVTGARNGDWEAASLGPCDAASPEPPRRCLYIGDTGDNALARASVSIYRIVEPPAERAGFTGQATSDRLEFTYADHPHDVESMYVGPSGRIYLITKRSADDAGGRRRPALVFRLEADAWRRPGRAVAELIDSIPAPGLPPIRFSTDAALAPDSRYAAVRTYGEVFIFRADTSSGRIRSDLGPSICDISGLHERQGEGITWVGTSGRLLLTSEGVREPARLVACALP